MATEQQTTRSGLDLNGIIFILARHKWKILSCAILGLTAAALVQFFTPAIYESRAKLLVRYVLDRSAIDSIEARSGTTAGINESIINSEVEILTSWDLAEAVAEAVGIARLVPDSKGEATKTAAARSISRGLAVTSRKGNNVLFVSYTNRDPEVASIVLRELVNRYFDKHLEIHRTGALDFVSQQTDQVRARLRMTEEELKKLKAEAGILSLADSTASINAVMARSQEELLLAEAEQAEQQARIRELEKYLGGGEVSQPKPEDDGGALVPAPVNSTDTRRYQALLERLTQLRKTEFELLARYTSDNQLVKSVRDQIQESDRECRRLEGKYPALVATAPRSVSAQTPQADLVSERARLAAVAAKIEMLKAQLRVIEERARKLAEAGAQITQIERRKEVEEANYKYFESSLEKARVDDALDSSKMPNISIVQKPSVAVRVWSGTSKLVLGLAGGGIALGIAIAFLIELVIDRSVRRAIEFETLLQIPLLLSIPYFSRRTSARLRLKSGADQNGHDSDRARQEAATQPNIAPWDASHFIRSYAEAIRDRLILSFELKKLTHRPKLVGIAGLSGGEGASTLACSLASALSETGDGKVLLVDMNASHSSTHSFFDGKPALGLSEALDASGSLLPAAENLYLATTSQNGAAMHIAPKRFYALMPHLKASQFDYVIFDMPPVSGSSATLAMAGCLDKLLLVVEAEKSDRNQVRRAYADLMVTKADVAGVFNKVRSPDI